MGIIIFQCFTLLMTQIFEIITQIEPGIFSRAAKKNYKQSIKAKMKKFFLTKNLTCYEDNQSFFVLLNAQQFCNSQFIGIDIFGLLQIITEPNNIHFKLCLLDCESIQIKAVSTYQKTGLAKLCNVLSRDPSQIIMSCHPLTGTIKFTITFQATELSEITQMLERALNIIKDHRLAVDKILQFLELVPHSMSNFLQKASEQMEKCRYFLLGPHEQCVHSSEKDLHQEYFIQSLSQSELRHCWLWQTQNKMFLNSVIQRLKSCYILRPLGVKKTNWLNLRPSQSSKETIKALEKIVHTSQKNKAQKIKPVVLNCQLQSSQTVPIEFRLKKEPTCRRQMQKIKNIAKLHYCTFLRQYVVLNNVNNQLTNYFTAQKYEILTSLNKFLSKYRPCLSFGSRLYLSQQILVIGYIGLTELKKFTPLYNLDNIQVTPDRKLKLKSIGLDSLTPTSIQIAQVCYNILYDIRCSSHKIIKQNQEYKICKKTHTIKVIDDGESKFEGLSIINLWLKKILLDVIDNKNRKYRRENRRMVPDDENLSSMNTEQCSQIDISQTLPTISKQIQSLEQILFVVSLAFKTYTELFGERWEDTIML